MNKTVFWISAAILLFFGSIIILNTSQNKQAGSLEIPLEEETLAPTQNPVTAPLFKGQQLAGNTSPYLAFTKEDYDKAFTDRKIIFLDFYANWCPICRAEAPMLMEGFNQLKTDQIIGFRVNFKDNETDDAEKQLAQDFSIPYQHTKVIIKDGSVVLKSEDSWDTQRFLSEITLLLERGE